MKDLTVLSLLSLSVSSWHLFHSNVYVAEVQAHLQRLTLPLSQLQGQYQHQQKLSPQLQQVTTTTGKCFIIAIICSIVYTCCSHFLNFYSRYEPPLKTCAQTACYIGPACTEDYPVNNHARGTSALCGRLCILIHEGLSPTILVCCVYFLSPHATVGEFRDILTLKVLVMTIDVQWEGMGDVGSARYEPALLPPCPTIRVLSYRN